MYDPESLKDRVSRLENLFFWMQNQLVKLQSLFDDYKRYTDCIYDATHAPEKELKWLFKEWKIPPVHEWTCESNKPRLINAIKLKIKDQFKRITEHIDNLIEKVSI